MDKIVAYVLLCGYAVIGILILKKQQDRPGVSERQLWIYTGIYLVFLALLGIFTLMI